MIEDKHIEFCSESYSIEKTIEVVVKGRTIRIEVLRQLRGERICSTRAYIEEDVYIQPCFAEEGTTEPRPKRTRIWTEYDLPWTERTTPDEALIQALIFLEDQFRK